MNKKLVIIVSVILTIITAGIILKVTDSNKDKVSIATNEKLKSSKFPSEKDGFIQIDLYFNDAKDEDKNLLKEERLLNKEELVGEIIIQELIKGPAVASNTKPVLPKETKLLSFSIKDGIAYVNFNSSAEFAMKEGQEKTLLSAVANSLTQLPSVEKVMITVENKNIETLGGNYNISKPFTKDNIDTIKIQK